jgi:hypothetical protein
VLAESSDRLGPKTTIPAAYKGTLGDCDVGDSPISVPEDLLGNAFEFLFGETQTVLFCYSRPHDGLQLGVGPSDDGALVGGVAGVVRMLVVVGFLLWLRLIVVVWCCCVLFCVVIVAADEIHCRRGTHHVYHWRFALF